MMMKRRFELGKSLLIKKGSQVEGQQGRPQTAPIGLGNVEPD